MFRLSIDVKISINLQHVILIINNLVIQTSDARGKGPQALILLIIFSISAKVPLHFLFTRLYK